MGILDKQRKKLQDIYKKGEDYRNKYGLSESPDNTLHPEIPRMQGSPFGITDYTSLQDPILAVPMARTVKRGWESDEQYDRRLQLMRQEEFNKAEEEVLRGKKQLEKVLRAANTAYVKDLVTNLRDNKAIPYEYYERQALEDLADEKQLIDSGYREDGTYYESRTNDLVNPFLHSILESEKMGEAVMAYQEDRYLRFQEEIGNLLSSDTISKEDLLDNEHLSTIYFDWAHNLDGSTKEDILGYWDERSEESKKEALLCSLLRNYYDIDALATTHPDLYKMYKEGSVDDIMTVASVLIKMDPNIKSLKAREAAKLGTEIDEASKKWGVKGYSEHLVALGTLLVLSAFQDTKWLGLGNIMELWTGGSAYVTGLLGSLTTNLVNQSIGGAIQYFSDSEEQDKLIEEHANKYFEKQTEAEYRQLMLLNPEDKERRQYLIKLFEEASENKEMGSVAYRANQGTYLTELEDSEKIRLGLLYEKQALLFGVLAALATVRNFWLNKVATTQTFGDAVRNTTGLFVTTALADVASFGALFYNVALKGTYTEGYVDNLVRNNGLMRWANDLMETGCFTPEELAYYKDLGINKYGALRTTSQEASLLTWDDIQDAIGQYGFTVGTTMISMGGSALVKSSLTKVALAATTSSKIRKALSWGAFRFRPKGRELYTSLLSTGRGAEATTLTLEALNRIKSAGIYRGNLLLDAGVGTAEGGLEAIGTYDTFKEEALLKYNELYERELQQAITSIMATPEAGDVNERIEAKKKDLEAKYSDIMKLAEEDAADAAALNFFSNAAINGFLAVTMKELTLSKDGRLAARQARGKNKKLHDYIQVAKQGKDLFIATVKDEFLKNGGTAGIAWKTLKKAVENIGGEALEEYGQGLTDAVSRALIQSDMDNYVNTVYNGGGLDAYTMDLGNMLKLGLDVLVENTTKKEILYQAYMGGLSSIVGGVNVFSGVARARLRIAKYRDDLSSGKFNDEGTWGKTKEFFKMAGSTVAGFTLNAFGESYREVQQERETALALADSVNTWLHNDKNKEFLTHLGGSLGFKHAMEEHLANGNLFEANNSKLGLAIENAFMLDALKETEVGKAYLDSMKDTLDLLSAVSFDDNGKLVVDANAIDLNTLERTRGYLEKKNRGKEVTDQEVIQQALKDIESAASLINSFRNSEGQSSRDLNMSDKEVADRIAKNILEFHALRDDINNARKQLAYILHDDSLDPMVEKVLVLAMLTLKDAKARYTKLKLRMAAALDSDALSEDLKQALQTSTEMSESLLLLIIKYGSLSKALAEITKLDARANEALVNSKNAKKYDEKAREDFRKEANKLTSQKTILEKLIEAATKGMDEEAKKEAAKAILKEGNLMNLSEDDLATVISNKKFYSEEQQKVIDNFIAIALTGLLNTEKEDINLTKEEIEKDFIDIPKLKSNGKLYDDYLADILGKSEFLNASVSAARTKKREDILSYLYKDDLVLKDGETFQDLADRIQQKITELREDGKLLDAAILLGLIDKDYKVKKIMDNHRMLNGMMYSIFHAARKDPNYTKGICGLRTLIDLGISLEEIKEMFTSGQHLAKIKEALRRKTNLLAEGGYLLNHFLLKEKQDPINVEDDTLLNTVISAMNKLVGVMTTVDEAKKRQQEAAKTAPPVGGTRGNDTPADTITLQGENSRLEVSSLANLDPSSQKFQILNNDFNMNSHLANYDNTGRDGKELSLVLYNHPTLGPIVLLATTTNRPKDAFQVGEFYYQAIGFIELSDNNKSDTLSMEIAKGGETRVLASPVQVHRIAETKAANAENKLTEQEYPTIIELINKLEPSKRKDEAVSNFADNIINGSWDTSEDESGDRTTVCIDHKGDPVIMNTGPNNDFWNLPVNGQSESLGALFEEIKRREDEGEPVADDWEELTLNLSESLFFRRIYKFWLENTLPMDSINYEHLFKNYILDFIYLGVPGKHYKVDVNIDGTNSTITINPNDGEPIVIPFPHGDTAGMRNAVTKMLFELWRTLNGIKTIKCARPLIPVLPKSGKAGEKVKSKFRGIVKDLINLGVLRGNVPQATDRGNVTKKFQIDNPFFKKAKSTLENPPVNPNDGDPSDPEAPEPKRTKIDMSQLAIDNRKKEAKNIIAKLIERAKDFVLGDKDADFYQEGEKQSARVTSVEYSTDGNLKKPTFTKLQQTKGKIASAHGTFVDTVIRNFFEIAYNSLPNNWSSMTLQERANWMLDAIKKSTEFNGQLPLGYENITELPSFIGNLIMIKELMDKKKWTVIPKDIKAFGTLDVTGAEGKVLPVAGTLDLLVVDEFGVFHIIDMKTKYGDEYYERGVQLSKDAWETLVAIYQLLLQQQYPNMVFGENYIFPIQVGYTEPAIDPEEIHISENGMELSHNNFPIGKASKAPLFQASFGKEEQTHLEDFLIPLEGINHHILLNNAKLNEELRKRLVQPTAKTVASLSAQASVPPPVLGAPIERHPHVTGAEEEGATGASLRMTADEVSSARASLADDSEFEGLDDLSTRTSKQARFTNFMNSRIKPVVSVKVSTIQKATHKLRKFIIGKKGMALLAARDLANTFFNGNMEKLFSIAGNTPLINTAEALHNIREYLKNLIQNKNQVLQNITMNHTVSKLLKLLFEGVISELVFLSRLDEQGIQPHWIDAYIEWKTAENQQAYTEKALENLEKSKDYSDEVLAQQLAGALEAFADMEAKLEFLESPNAVYLIKERLHSIERALFRGLLQPVRATTSGTIEKLRTSKGETFGAIKLLEDIIAKSQNVLTRALARVLLRNIKYNGLGILVTVDPSMNAIVEGATDGLSITLNPEILKDGETLERVLLHEIIHCVVKASPEMTEQLEELRQETIQSLKEATGMSEEDLIEQNYGLKNTSEFIAEFFTNYAFQAKLKQVSSKEGAHTSIFRKIIDAISDFFRRRSRDKQLFDKIETTMENILLTNNVPSNKKESREVNVAPLGRYSFEMLDEETQEAIKASGGTERQFNDLTKIEQEYVIKCCSF